jgi:hypothetical protein
MTPLKFEIPLRTPSVANLRESWVKRQKRTANQRAAVRMLCPKWKAGPVLVVKLTRVAPRQLDSDNWVSAAKAIRDGVASWLRIDDGSPLIEFRYGQEVGPESVVVEVMAP